MATKLWLIALLLALVMVADSTSFDDASWMTRLNGGDDNLSAAQRSCNGRVGDCIGDLEEEMLDSEFGRRQLAARRRYISYDALKRDTVPCRRPGQSYYYCRGNQRANPYKRGCTYITHCARDLN